MCVCVWGGGGGGGEGGSVVRGCSPTNYGVTYEETQSNRVSDFRDFVCPLFPKAIIFDFYNDVFQNGIEHNEAKVFNKCIMSVLLTVIQPNKVYDKHITII